VILGTSNTRSVHLAGLRSVRRRRGLAQRELAALAQTGQQTVCQLETLRRGAYPKTIRKLASALGVAPAELMDDHHAE
jgi:transcriptional regulator with XRE-family HTH domain